MRSDAAKPAGRRNAENLQEPNSATARPERSRLGREEEVEIHDSRFAPGATAYWGSIGEQVFVPLDSRGIELRPGALDNAHDELMESFKDRAREIGANAIVDVEVSYDPVNSDRIGMNIAAKGTGATVPRPSAIDDQVKTQVETTPSPRSGDLHSATSSASAPPTSPTERSRPVLREKWDAICKSPKLAGEFNLSKLEIDVTMCGRTVKATLPILATAGAVTKYWKDIVDWSSDDGDGPTMCLAVPICLAPQVHEVENFTPRQAQN